MQRCKHDQEEPLLEADESEVFAESKSALMGVKFDTSDLQTD